MFCLQMAYELSNKFKVLYLSLEMTVEEAMFRLLCYQQRMENTYFYSGRDYDHRITAEKFKNKLYQVLYMFFLIDKRYLLKLRFAPNQIEL